MINKKTIAVLVFLFSLACFPVNTASAQNSVISDHGRDVEVYFFLIDIEEIDSVSQSFVANIYVELSWHDPSLAHSDTDSIMRRLGDVWYPRVQFLNQQRLLKTFPDDVEVRPDGDVIFRQRYWGNFSQPLQLQDFPFDTQQLNITLVETGFGAIRANFIVSSESGVSETLKISDWQIMDWKIAPVELSLGELGEPINSVVFSTSVERFTSFFTLNVILPLILIVMMSWLVFWIDPSMAATQISVSVTAMLTLIAYRFAIGGMVPRLAFLTSLDYFVLGSSILVFMALVEVVISAHLSHNGKLDRARSMDRTARWLAPGLFLLVMLESFIFRFGL